MLPGKPYRPRTRGDALVELGSHIATPVESPVTNFCALESDLHINMLATGPQSVISGDSGETKHTGCTREAAEPGSEVFRALIWPAIKMYSFVEF